MSISTYYPFQVLLVLMYIRSSDNNHGDLNDIIVHFLFNKGEKYPINIELLKDFVVFKF